ncbi:MAG: cytochrome c3 family protein [Myxococcota bacterium]
MVVLAGSTAQFARAADTARVAKSVCEAHRLKALKQADPDLEIEIPPQFNTPWPSLAACESHDRASDATAPGPLQPIPFSHKHHAGQFGIDCQYCHSGTDRSRMAGVPSVELCMGCHAQFPPQYDQLEGIRTLKQHWGIEFIEENGQFKALARDPAKARPIQWQQIHRLPEHVKFRHNRHVAAGVTCQRCHGAVEQTEKLYLVPDTKWWYGVPAQKLEMGWCVQCHRENQQQASQDCLRCHH